jgi:hypothetical protein
MRKGLAGKAAKPLWRGRELLDFPRGTAPRVMIAVSNRNPRVVAANPRLAGSRGSGAG